jgi:hypothetical protein
MNTYFQPLFFKYWKESRTKFLIASVLIIAIIIYAINGAGITIKSFNQNHTDRKIVFTQYVWVILYKGYLLTIYTFASFMFGLGGVMHEKQNGSILFSLSLPLKRTWLVRTKLISAVTQVIALSFLPVLVLPIISALYHFAYPVKEAFFFSLLMSCGGILIMFLGAYLSLIISKELVIPSLGTAILITLYFVLKFPAMEDVNIFNAMIGAGYLSSDNFLFIKPLNFIFIAICLLTGLTSALIYEKAICKKDF